MPAHCQLPEGTFVYGKRQLLQVTDMKRKQIYVAPRSEMLPLKPEGVLCGSVKVTFNNPMGNGNPEDEWTF